MDTTLLVVLVAFGVVVLTSLFKVVELSDKVKQTIALLVSAAAGALTAYTTGQFDNVTDVAQTVLVIYGLSQGIYQFFFDSGRILGGFDETLEGFRVGSAPDTGVDPAHEDNA